MQEKAATTTTLQHLPEFSSKAAFPSAPAPAKVTSPIWDLGLAAGTLFQTWEKQDRKGKHNVQF